MFWNKCSLNAKLSILSLLSLMYSWYEPTTKISVKSDCKHRLGSYVLIKNSSNFLPLFMFSIDRAGREEHVDCWFLRIGNKKLNEHIHIHTYKVRLWVMKWKRRKKYNIGLKLNKKKTRYYWKTHFIKIWCQSVEN